MNLKLLLGCLGSYCHHYWELQQRKIFCSCLLFCILDILWGFYLLYRKSRSRISDLMQNSTHSVWSFWVFPQQKAVFIVQQQHPGQRTQWRAMNLLPLHFFQSSWMYNFYLNNISQGINSSLSLIILFLFSSLFLNLFLNFHFLSIQLQLQRQRLVIQSFPDLWHSYVLSSSSLWDRGSSLGAQQEQVKSISARTFWPLHHASQGHQSRNGLT